MKCPKCNKEIPYDHNLCGYCGNTIREKCPECGEMELLGRKVCKTKLKEAREKLAIYSGEKEVMDKSVTPAALTGVLITPLFGIIFYFSEKYIGGWAILPAMLAIVVVICLLVFYLYSIDLKVIKLKQEFFRLHPEYAEIIKKAEGEREK